VIRLGLTDDEPLFTMGLAMLLGAQPDMEVVWQAVDGNDALRCNAADPVDVLLLDVQMPGLDGLSTTRELVARGITGRVVILTTFDTDGYVMGSIEAGAAGFLLKNTPPQDLIAAIHTVHDGDSVISPGPTRRLLTAVRAGQIGGAGAGAACGVRGLLCVSVVNVYDGCPSECRRLPSARRRVHPEAAHCTSRRRRRRRGRFP